MDDSDSALGDDDDESQDSELQDAHNFDPELGAVPQALDQSCRRPVVPIFATHHPGGPCDRGRAAGDDPGGMAAWRRP